VKRAIICTVAIALIAALPASAGRSEIGRSVKDRSIALVTRGDRNAETSILVVGCIHGNECAARPVVRRLKRIATPSGVRLLLVSALNPDGAAAGTRQNARGVDLNRNFSRGWRGGGRPWDTYYPGPRPFSEPETRAARDLIERMKPDITIWYHQAMSLVAKQPRHLRTQRRYARRTRLPLEKLDPLPGTASRWQNHRWPGHLSFVVELPGGALPWESVKRHASAVVAAGKEWR
jgi:protein MpaA